MVINLRNHFIDHLGMKPRMMLETIMEGQVKLLLRSMRQRGCSPKAQEVEEVKEKKLMLN